MIFDVKKFTVLLYVEYVSLSDYGVMEIIKYYPDVKYYQMLSCLCVHKTVKLFA